MTQRIIYRTMRHARDSPATLAICVQSPKGKLLEHVEERPRKGNVSTDPSFPRLRPDRPEA